MHIHPEYRAEWAFNRILFSAMTSLTHQQRVKLALALYHRYQFKLKKEAPELKLISAADRSWAKLVGTAANLAYHLSGSIAGNLPYAKLALNGEGVALQLSERMKNIMGEAVQRRLGGVDETYKAYAKK